MQGAGQTRPQTPARGVVRASTAAAAASPSFARACTKPITSFPAGQNATQGAGWSA
jgi:hypothetical protein